MSPRNQKLSATICLTPLLLVATSATRADMVINPNPESADTVYMGPGVAIPDNAPGVTSVINVPDSYSILSMTITINMGPPTHTWIGDLVLTLTHGATSIDLMRKVGSGTAGGLGDSSDFGGSYVFTDGAGSARLVDAANIAGAAVVVPPGSYRATNNIFNGNGAPTFTGEQIVNINAAFGGADVNGAWTLSLTDTASGDTGTLASWSIDVTGVPEPSTFALLGIMAAGAIGVRAWRKRKVA